MALVSLELAAIDFPETVGHARRWLRQRLGNWSEECVEEAELVLSELVTNAVLHGHGPTRISLSKKHACVALEVVDGTPSLPVVHHYPADATTGRGLHLIDQLSLAWGVRGFIAGKGVWALLVDPSERAEGNWCLADFTPDSWLLGDPTLVDPATTPPSPPGAAAIELVPVEIRGLPLEIYGAAQEHNDALLRELTLVAHGEEPDTVPARLVALATEMRTQFAQQGTAVRSQVARAVSRGQHTVDFSLAVPLFSRDAIQRLATILDEADEYCRSGELLTLTATPQVRYFRDWYLTQVLSQLNGEAATPWQDPSDDSEGDRQNAGDR